MLNTSSFTNLMNYLNSNTRSTVSSELLHKRICLSNEDSYTPPVDAVAVRVAAGTAWIGFGRSNIALFRSETLTLNPLLGEVSITSMNKRDVILEVYFKPSDK